MKSIFKLAFAVLLLIGVSFQLSAQCGNTNPPIVGNDGNGGFIGQSFIANCSGPNFTQLNMYRSGRNISGNDVSEFTGTITIYEGESVDAANEIYTQTAIFPAIPLDGGNTLMEIPLTGGTGSTAFVQGQMYTFRFGIPSNSYRWSVTSSASGPNFTEGRINYGGQWWEHADLVFEMLSGASSAAACNISQTTFINSNAMPTISNHAQSFSGACTEPGTFSHLQINRKDFGARTGTLYIYNGESVDPANQVYTQPISLPAAPTGTPQYYNVEIPIGGGTGDLSYTPGNVYTYRIATVGNIIPTTYNVGSSHPGGSAYWDGVFKSGSDFYFDITIEETVPPVPTMGEWALITFGLIIMSMGVITVRRREEDLIAQAA